MIKKVKLGNEVYELQINNSNGFNYLNLISAKIDGAEYFKEVPSVEMILLNDKAMFTLYTNMIPGTNCLNCFDLLETASNNPALINERFHTLKCILSEKRLDKSFEIELEFEIE